ncbi:ATP-binding protein [Nocardia asteroides]|uniref:ATP-binding protein n=1 Tax=Nocardia asteroides TaxID=1824 RepID=UPI001E619D97|nr:ATP-binding protein [Nocardia asteroides]UGT62025.1 ATP-binding protein [Nocardia asteroides]
MNSEVEPLRIEFPASPDELPGVRSRLRRWLAGMIADSQRAYDLLLAAGEACANAIEHGHAGDRRPIRLEAIVARGAVLVGISDHGHWVARPAAPDDERGHTESLRGRGLQMIKALVHESRVTVLDSGTTVTLSMPLDADGAAEGSQAR